MVGILTVIEEGEPEEVAVYCPDCAKREFEARMTSPADSGAEASKTKHTSTASAARLHADLGRA